MNIKRFVASNMRDALKSVREEVGPDAIIISNKKIADGVEIIVSLEGSAAPEPSKHHSLDSASRYDEADYSVSLSSQAISNNPFNDEDVEAHAQARLQQEQQRRASGNKLGAEVSRMQQEAKHRAEALAASLSKQNTITAEPYDIQERINKKAIEKARSMYAGDDSNVLNSSTTFTGQAENKASELNEGRQESAVVENISTINARDEVVATTQRDTASLQNDPQKSEAEIMQLRNELQTMRDMLEQQFSVMSWEQYKQQSPNKAVLSKRLKRMGIDTGLAQQLLSTISEQQAKTKDIWQYLMIKLAYELSVDSSDVVASGGIFVFVGPTGAGKTTTIGKLAARYVLKHGPNNIALVSTDSQRIAGSDQLRTYGRVLNVPVKVVDQNNSLEEVLYTLRNKDLILIDTGGVTNQSQPLADFFEEISPRLSARMQSLLVLPATAHAKVLRNALHKYDAPNLSSCIYTKLDEAVSLGELISISVEESLSVAYTTDGQNVPDDIAVVSARDLVKQAINLGQEVHVDDEVMASSLQSIAHVK